MSSTQVSKPVGPLEKILVTGATGQQGGTLASFRCARPNFYDHAEVLVHIDIDW